MDRKENLILRDWYAVSLQFDAAANFLSEGKKGTKQCQHTFPKI